MTDHSRIPEIRDGSKAAAKPVRTPTLSEQIARQVLSEAFSTLRIRVLKPEAISEIRAEVKRRVALNWQRAA